MVSNFFFCLRLQDSPTTLSCLVPCCPQLCPFGPRQKRLTPTSLAYTLRRARDYPVLPWAFDSCRQGRRVCAICQHAPQSRHDLGNGAALVGAQAEGRRAGVMDTGMLGRAPHIAALQLAD